MAKKRLLKNGLMQGCPMQTVTFGGVTEDINNKKNYWNRLEMN